MNHRPFCLTLLVVTGCSVQSPPVRDSAPKTAPVDIMSMPDAVPKPEKRTRAGNPERYQVLGRQYKVNKDSKGFKQRGIASWYGGKFHGRKTANGEIFDMFKMTAAHKTLPIPSYVRVTNLKNRRSVVVRVNDRGPFHGNRIIDLSYAAAVKLGVQRSGLGLVEIQAVEPVIQSDSRLADASEQQSNGSGEKKLSGPSGRSKSQALRQPKSAAESGDMYLQVGAFNNRMNAHQLQRKIAGLPLSSRLKIEEKRGDTLYKVQLGPVDSTELADKLNNQLTELGVTNVTLVSDD